jgi:hypothetical protein
LAIHPDQASALLLHTVVWGSQAFPLRRQVLELLLLQSALALKPHLELLLLQSASALKPHLELLLLQSASALKPHLELLLLQSALVLKPHLELLLLQSASALKPHLELLLPLLRSAHLHLVALQLPVGSVLPDSVLRPKLSYKPLVVFKVNQATFKNRTSLMDRSIPYVQA